MSDDKSSSKDRAMTERVAARLMKAMAYDRQTFKDKVEEHVGGALLEFYKATLARKNGQTRWVQHWMTEVHTLLDHNLVLVIHHDVRGFKDLRKALNEVVARLKVKDGGYRVTAEHQVKRDFALKRLKAELDNADTATFWERVDAAVEAAFAGLEP